jgi:hypothetical protein
MSSRSIGAWNVRFAPMKICRATSVGAFLDRADRRYVVLRPGVFPLVISRNSCAASWMHFRLFRRTGS